MKHEKIILVLLGYTIGFTTAFIGFALTDDKKHERKSEMYANKVLQKNYNQLEGDSSVSVIFDDSGMYAVVDGNKKVVSGVLTETVPPGPGFHSEIPFYSVSPSGKYIYYCEQEQEADGTCSQYLYLINEHVIKPLKLNGESLSSSVADSGFTWTENGQLISDEYSSVSEAEPWKLVQK